MLRKVIRCLGYVLAIPFVYLLTSLVLTGIGFSDKHTGCQKDRELYLSTNGIHADFVLPLDEMSRQLRQGLKVSEADRFLSFGWGDKAFYLNTPEWRDLTVGTALRAAFLPSEALVHVYRYENPEPGWKRVDLCDHQLSDINEYIATSFVSSPDTAKQLLANTGYGPTDDFYLSRGSFSCLYTCNSWVNSGLKKAGMKACLWTPFDFGVLKRY